MDRHRRDDATTEAGGEPSRRAVLRGIGGIGLAALLAARWRPAAAQDATPAPLIHGITLTVLGSGVPHGAPDQVLHLIRGVQAPGGWIAPHYHPGAQVFYVDQGTIGFTVYKGDLRLVRAGMATPGATPGTAGEMVPPGTEVILTPGTWL
jgi:hypothetical protein